MRTHTVTKLKLKIKKTALTEKTLPSRSFFSLASIQAFCLLTVSFSFVWCLLSLLRTDKIEFMPLFLSALLYSSLITLIFSTKYRYPIVFIVIFASAGYLYTKREPFLSGAKQFINLIIEAVNPYYGIQIEELPVSRPSALHFIFFIYVLLAVITFLFAFSLIIIKRSFVLVILDVSLLLFGLMLGRLPNFAALFFVIISMYSAAVLCNKKGYIISYLFCIYTSLLFLGVSGFISSKYASSLLNYHDTLIKTEESVENAIASGSWYYDIFLSGNISLFTSPQGTLNNYPPKFSTIDILKITTPSQPKTNLYFKEWAASDYNDGKWEDISEEDFQTKTDFSKSEYYQDTDKISRAVQNLSYTAIRTFIAVSYLPVNITVTNLRESNQKIYSPYFCKLPDSLKTTSDGYAKNELQTQSNEILYLGYPFYGSSYMDSLEIFQYIGMSLNNIQNMEKPLQFIDIVLNTSPENLPDDYLVESMYRQYVYEEYTKLPSKNMELLKNLCQSQNLPASDIPSITEFITSYLSENASYSTNLSRLPKDRDFVDYFLFEEKQGFCTHFASAATLMYRMFGIPARYVGGYIAYPDSFHPVSRRDPKGPYEAFIKDSQAHAWTEIYLDGFGWVPVETTPGYRTVENTEETAPSPDLAANNVLAPLPSAAPIIDSPIEEVPEKTANITPQPKKNNVGNREEIKTASPLAGRPFVTLFAAVFIFLFLVAGTILLKRKIIYQKQQRLFHDSDYNAAAANISHQLYLLLLYSRLIKDSFTDDSEYAAVIDLCFSQNKGDFICFQEIVQRAVFGPSPITAEELSFCCLVHHNLQQNIYNKVSGCRRFLLRYLYCL